MEMGTQIPPIEFNLEFSQGSMKTAMKSAGATSRDLLMVPLENIKIISGFNVRVHDASYEAEIEKVKASIIENGFYQHKPLSGYAAKEGDQTLIYCAGGATRLEAAKRAKAAGAPIDAIPIVLKPPGTSMIDLMVGLDVDNQGRPLKPYERAIVVKRLMGYGADQETIAKRLSISEQYIGELLYLMSLPKALQGIVIVGKAAAYDVVRLARKVGPAEALKAFEASVPGAPPSDESSAGTGGSPAAGSGAGTGSAKKPIVPKKTLFSAIDYAIALPANGIAWLKKWREGDGDALAELAAYKPPRKGSKAAAEKKANGADKDPFDTTPRRGRRKKSDESPAPAVADTNAAKAAADDDPL